MSLRFHRVSCTLPRCHKERRCRSHRTVRQVCACVFVCVSAWVWEWGERENNQPLLVLSHSSWYIKFLRLNVSPDSIKLLQWTHAWESSGLLGRKIMLSALVWDCQSVVLEVWFVIWSTSGLLMTDDYLTDWLYFVLACRFSMHPWSHSDMSSFLHFTDTNTNCFHLASKWWNW